MSYYEKTLRKLINDLGSSDLSKRIEAIRTVGKSRRFKELAPNLSNMLSVESDINVLNELALSLGKLKYHEAVPKLMKYVNNPDFSSRRGTFIYALQSLDCREYFLDFVKMICDGNFEVFSHSLSVLESIIDKVSYELRLEGKKILENQKKIELSRPVSEYPQFDRIRFIEEALDLLKSD
jgi:HEAT repeat protein